MFFRSYTSSLYIISIWSHRRCKTKAVIKGAEICLFCPCTGNCRAAFTFLEVLSFLVSKFLHEKKVWTPQAMKTLKSLPPTSWPSALATVLYSSAVFRKIFLIHIFQHSSRVCSKVRDLSRKKHLCSFADCWSAYCFPLPLPPAFIIQACLVRPKPPDRP